MTAAIIREKIVELEQELEDMKKKEQRLYWEEVNRITNELHRYIVDKYGVEPSLTYHDGGYKVDMPTGYKVSLNDVAKTIMRMKRDD